MVQKWILPTISEVLAQSEPVLTDGVRPKLEWTAATENWRGDGTPNAGSKNQTLALLRAEREWQVAIAALEQLLLQSTEPNTPSAAGMLPVQGLVFAGPVPVLSHQALLSMPTWIFQAESLNSRAGARFQLPPATEMPIAQALYTADYSNAGPVIPLLPDDPLSNEQFCLVLTAKFSLVMVLGEDLTGAIAFLFSFEPEVIEQAWRSLRERVALSCPHFSLKQLDALVEQYHPVVPDYRTVTQFSRLLLKHLPEAEESKEDFLPQKEEPSYPSPRPEVELLQAFAHEVRTPLTTIRTLTRLLLKRSELTTDVIKRLKIIDHECTEQIDRMELLFRAAELESTAKRSAAQLTAMSLSHVLQQSIPRWQSSASRRNLTLDVALPQHLPSVVSDPMMLDQVLTGLIENFTRSLPAGSHIQVQVIPAGDQLKLQLLPQPQSEESGTVEQFSTPLNRKSLGPLLMFQPETGNISLNLTVTKHLFQAIGGKLIVRQRPHQGEVLTIFLPLELTSSSRPKPGDSQE